MYENITDSVWNYLQGEDTKIAKRILNALDYDICYFYADWSDKSITLEKTYSGAVIPDYLFNYMVRNNDKILAFTVGVRN